MSIFRRPTRAAGHTWSKWEDPIVYAAPVEARLRHLASWVLLGAAAAELAVVAFVPADRAGLPGFSAAILTAVALALAVVSIVRSWDETTENE